MSLFSELAHLLPARSLARANARLRGALADPFEVLHRYYFDAPWLESKLRADCRD
ncbi:hypothetical protein [Sphingobium nicotianae]|uniref:Uncharacterized protein n=1 Tax=Sphingobium nicotianae TaxID=2782607 RepID=A0A9X1ISH5_9SPHN|nr:hypothetical protein [Sphingobium nicotianae]MBT2188190.1 hypothetical protein [Sphingobium nicotianae]